MNTGRLPAVARRVMAINSADPDIVRRAHLLHTLVVGVLILAALYIPVEILGWRGLPSVVLIGVILLALAIGAVAIRFGVQGHPRAGAYLFLGFFWTALTLLVLTQPDEISALLFLPYMYAIPVLAGGLIAGRQAPFLFAALATAALLLVPLVYAPWEWLARDPAGQIVSQGRLDVPVYLARDAVFFFLIAFMSYLAERTLAQAMRETGRQATDRAVTEAGALQQQRARRLASTMHAQAAALAETVQDQTQTMRAQETAVQDVTTTVDALAATAQAIAAAAREVSASAARVLRQVADGQTTVDRTSDAVAHLGTRVAAIGESVEIVDTHVQQIWQIADLLTEVGDSIHLLALNATIEAAGAGTYGRRFEIVAREIQELAARVRVASEQVQTQVHDIQAATVAALQSSRAGIAAAGAAVTEAAQTRATHLAIHGIAEQASAQAAQIAAGTVQQQTASGQVLATLRALSQSVTALVGGSARVAVAADRLSALAVELDAVGEAAAEEAPPLAVAAP